MDDNITIFTSHKLTLESCPPNLQHNIKQWQHLNKTFNFKYFDDQALHKWMRETVSPETYNRYMCLNSGAGKADMFRICYLYHIGGIWVDADLPAFNILHQKPDFASCLKENEALLIRNRKCDNPRYTFIASYNQKNSLYGGLIKLINKHISFVLNSQKKFTTIHITGPFVLHKLIKIKYNLSNINELKLNYKYRLDDSHFMYIDDIIPERKTYDEENVYKGYRDDLKYMNVIPHTVLNSVRDQSDNTIVNS